MLGIICEGTVISTSLWSLDLDLVTAHTGAQVSSGIR